jgi:hypothetical protein
MVKKWLKRIFWAGVAVFAGIQLVPVNLTNPPVNSQQALNPPPAVEAILRVACYDCHSNETRWPWYSHVAPMSWMVNNHVTEGRLAMDFSIWASYKPDKQADYLRDIKDAVTNGWMPLSSYLLIHRDAVLTPDQVKIVADWAGATADKLDPPATAEEPTAKPTTLGGT